MCSGVAYSAGQETSNKLNVPPVCPEAAFTATRAPNERRNCPSVLLSVNGLLWRGNIITAARSFRLAALDTWRTPGGWQPGATKVLQSADLPARSENRMQTPITFGEWLRQRREELGLT